MRILLLNALVHKIYELKLKEDVFKVRSTKYAVQKLI